MYTFGSQKIRHDAPCAHHPATQVISHSLSVVTCTMTKRRYNYDVRLRVGGLLRSTNTALPTLTAIHLITTKDRKHLCIPAGRYIQTSQNRLLLNASPCWFLTAGATQSRSWIVVVYTGTSLVVTCDRGYFLSIWFDNDRQWSYYRWVNISFCKFNPPVL